MSSVDTNTVCNMILSNSTKTDIEKLQLIFNMYKAELKTKFPYLYYAILAVLDKKKKPDPSEYFNSNKKATSEETITKIAIECINGKWGNGAVRQDNLAIAGYNYKEVQNKVNEIMPILKEIVK